MNGLTVFGYCREMCATIKITLIPVMLMHLITEFYKICEHWIKAGAKLQIIKYGATIKCDPHGTEIFCLNSYTGGLSALGALDISFNNNIEHYQVDLCITELDDEFERYRSAKNITIGICNTEQHNIDVSHLYLPQIAMHGQREGVFNRGSNDHARIKAYGVSFNGDTTKIESGGTTIGSCLQRRDTFKVNDIIKLIINLKYQYIKFIKNSCVLFKSNIKMDTSTLFRLFCSIKNIEKKFELTIIKFVTKKYESANSLLCQPINPLFDAIRDEVLLKQKVKVWLHTGLDEQEMDLWSLIGKGVLQICFDGYNDSNRSRMMFYDKNDTIQLLLFLDGSIELYAKTDNYVEITGYDYINDEDTRHDWRIRFSDEQSAMNFIEILKTSNKF